MGIYRLAWGIWIIGTAMIVLSWGGHVSNDVGWLGFGIAFFGFLLSCVPYLRPQRGAYPLTQEGFPVQPSGIRVDANTRLDVGARVLAFSQGRWWRATVLEVEAGDTVRVNYAGWDPLWVESLPRESLQLDLAGGSESSSSPYRE